MSKRYWISASILSLILIFNCCTLKKNSSSDITQVLSQGGNVTITGQVISNSSGNAIVGAIERIQVDTTTYGAQSDSSGNFKFNVTIKKGGDLMMITSKAQYTPDTTIITAVVGQTIKVPIIRLFANKVITIATGYPASIQLINQSLTTVGVKESGAEEASTITFQIQDSSGVGVDVNHGTTVNFSINGGPNGGEFVSPTSVHTDGYGKVNVTFNSGSKAGVAMVIAQAVFNGNTLKSRPIPITIQGGLPVSFHFMVGTPTINYGFWGLFNQTISVGALLGDRYSNPVRPGTTVYFTTTYNGISNYHGGIILPSAQTDNTGVASVTLETEAFPIHPDLIPGQFVITASTVDETGQYISTNNLRMLSGLGIITVNPTTFNIPNNGSQSFTYQVIDVNGNPLAGGTSISVQVQGGTLNLSGDTGIKLPDTMNRGPGLTTFGFNVADNDTTIKPANVSITISANGPAGQSSITIYGTSK